MTFLISFRIIAAMLAEFLVKKCEFSSRWRKIRSQNFRLEGEGHHYREGVHQRDQCPNQFKQLDRGHRLQPFCILSTRSSARVAALHNLDQQVQRGLPHQWPVL
jgi:hypothetical protein